MANGRKPRRNGRGITLQPLGLESALSAALKVPPPSDKPRRGEKSNEQECFEKVTEMAIDAYEEALKELEKR